MRLAAGRFGNRSFTGLVGHPPIDKRASAKTTLLLSYRMVPEIGLQIALSMAFQARWIWSRTALGSAAPGEARGLEAVVVEELVDASEQFSDAAETAQAGGAAVDLAKEASDPVEPGGGGENEMDVKAFASRQRSTRAGRSRKTRR